MGRKSSQFLHSEIRSFQFFGVWSKLDTMMIDLSQFPRMSGPEARLVLQAFELSGVAIRFVGGCVRDAILGVAAQDIDLAVPVDPELSTEILEKAGIKVIPTGISFGTITAVIGDETFQITSLRHDIRTFGRHAVVCYGSDWHEDAERRDFTFNALYADSRGHIYDYFNGIKDLKEGRVRFIGDPSARIREDYLRILRFFRFFAWYGQESAPDSAAIEACQAHIDGLDVLSSERITTEFLKLLSAKNPKNAVEHLIQVGAGLHVVHHPLNLEAFALFLTLEDLTQLPLSTIGRFAALKLGVPPRITHHLRLKRKDQDVLNLYRKQAPVFPVPEKEWGSYLYELHPHAFTMLMHLGCVNKMQLRVLTMTEADQICQMARTQSELWKKPLFPLKGKDLLDSGLKAGPSLGKRLKACEHWWVQQNFEPDFDACITWAMNYK